MKFNKRCLTAFSDERPFMAMGTKSKLFDTSFSLTSELFLYDYSLGVQYPSLQTDNKFYKLKWCEAGDVAILATGNEEGKVSLYAPTPEKNTSFELLSSCCVLEGDVLGLDFNPSKGVLAAGSSNGKIIFWNLNKLDSQYTSDIPLSSNITCLSWNKKVSRILCAGTDDGKILILDIRAKSVAMTLGGDEISMVTDVMWHPSGSTSILAATNQRKLQCFNLSSDSTSQIGEHVSGLLRLSMVDKSHISASSKDKIEIIEMGENVVVDTIPVDGVFDVSFSRRDPLLVLSHVGGTTEIVPRVTRDVLPSVPGCIVGGDVVGREMYKIEDRKMESVEEDGLVERIKKLLYPDGSYKLDRKGLGELLLSEATKAGEGKEMEELGSKVSGMSLGSRLDLSDPLTLALVRGDLDEAYKESVKSSKTVPFSHFLALAKGNGTLSLDSDDPLVLLSTAQITSTFSDFLEKMHISQWMALLAVISFSSLSDRDFFLNAMEIAGKVSDEEKLLVYAMINRLNEYFELKESMYRMPASVYEVRDFFQQYKGMVADLESMAGVYESPMISEYFWHALTRGEKPVGIKYKDLGINIHLGRAESNVKAIGKPSPTPTSNSHVRSGALKGTSPIGPQHHQGSVIGKYGVSPASPSGVSGAQAGFSRQSEGNMSTTSSLGKPSIPGVSVGSLGYRSPAQPLSPPGIPQHGLKTSNSVPELNRSTSSVSPPGSQQRMQIPKPGYRAVPSTPSYGNVSPAATPRPYGSMPSMPNLTGSSPAVSTYGMASQGAASHGHAPHTPAQHGAAAKPYIPRPGMPSSPSQRAPDLQPKPSIPTPQLQAREMEPQAKAATHPASPLMEKRDLNGEEILNTFEGVIRELIEKASAKANLIVRNKLKEVTKRLSIYNSVTRGTFSPVILSGIDRINNEIKDDGNADAMKQRIREVILECTESGENRADLWMPSVYTLLQIVYH